MLLNLCHGPKSVFYADEVNATTYIVVEVVGCFDFDFINLDRFKIITEKTYFPSIAFLIRSMVTFQFKNLTVSIKVIS